MNWRNDSQGCKGFTLIEIIVVLVIISIIALLLPQGLQRLYSRSNVDNVTQSAASILRDCALKAQTLQLTLTVGTKACPIDLPNSFEFAFEADNRPTFYPDGTSNGDVVIVSHGTQQITVRVDRLTSNINISKDVIN